MFVTTNQSRFGQLSLPILAATLLLMSILLAWPQIATAAPGTNEAQLQVTKSVADEPLIGGEINFTINVQNSANTGDPLEDDKAYNITITDTLPAGIAYSNASPAPNSVTVNPDGTTTLVWVNLTDLEQQEATSISVSGVLSSSLSVGSVVANTADASGREFPDNSGATFSASGSVTATLQAIDIEKELLQSTGVNQATGASGWESTAPGDGGGPEWPYQYKLTVQNNNVGDTTNVVVTDTLPPGVAYLGPTTITPNPNGSTVTPTMTVLGDGSLQLVWNLGTITTDEHDAPIEILFNVAIPYQERVAPAGDILCDDGNIRVPNSTDPTDPGCFDGAIIPDHSVWENLYEATGIYDGTPTADGTTSTPEDDQPIPVTAVFQTIQKSASPSVVAYGDTVNFTLEYFVSEYYTLTGSIITDVLPDGLTYITGSASLAPISVVTNTPDVGQTTIVWNIDPTNTTPGDQNSITFDARVLTQFDNPADDPPIVANDALQNNVTMSGIYTDDVSPADTPINNETVDSDSASVGTTLPSIDKKVFDPATNTYVTGPVSATIGDELEFRLVYVSPSGIDAGDNYLADFLPRGMSFVAQTSCTASGTITNTFPITYTNDTDNDPCTFTQYTVGGLNVVRWNFGFVEAGFAMTNTITAHIDDIPQLEDGQELANFLKLSGLNTPGTAYSLRDQALISIVEPEVVLDKSVSPGGVIDVGQAATYQIVIRNTGTYTAYNNVVTDTLPTYLQINTGSCSATPSPLSCSVQSGSPQTGAGGVVAWNNIPELGVGEAYTLTYEAMLITGTPADTDIINIATVGYNTQADNSGRQTAGNGDTNEPNTDDATIMTAVPSVAKSYVTSNQTHTADPNVAIGEVITYQLTIEIPEGISDGVQVVDVLDEGLAFASQPEITAASGSLTIDNSPPNNSFTAVGAGASNAGRQVTIDLGSVANSDIDTGTTETITIQYAVVVLNSAGNNRGTSLNNVATLRVDGTDANTASATDVTIVEPELDITKTVTSTTGDAGDVLTYTLTVDHATASDADAFNVVLVDAIPTGLTYVGGSLNQTAGPGATNTVIAGNTITLTWDTYETTQPASTFTFRVTIDGDVVPSQELTNTAALEWTSLPDVISTTQAISNTLGVERTGDSSDVGGSNNDHNDNDSALITITDPEPTKSIVATSETHTTINPSDGSRERIAVGEIVRFRLQVRLPETTINNFMLRDYIENGLQFLDDGSAMVAFVANSATGITSTQVVPADIPCNGGANPTLLFVGNDPSAVTPECPMPDLSVNARVNGDDDNYNSGRDVYFRFGRLANHDHDPDNEYLIVEFNALVLNNSEIYADRGRANRFRVRINGVEGPDSNRVRMRVVEPVIEIGKQFITPQADAGDTISFTLTVSNTASGRGAAAGFDIQVVDMLDPALTFSGLTVSVPSYTVFTDTTAAPNITVTIDRLDPGDNAIITVTATVNDSVVPGETITNTADVTATSLPGPTGTISNTTGSSVPGGSGDGTGERNGSGTGENDYNDSSTDTLPTGGPEIAKAFVSSDQPHTSDPNVTIGEVITYRLTITLPEGTAPTLVVTDTLPAGLRYVSGSVAVDAAGFGGTFTDNPPTVTGGSGDGVAVAFDFGETIVTGDNNLANNSFSLTLRALVLDVPSNVGVGTQTVLTNTAVFKIGDEPPITSNPVENTVVEPNMVITKTIDPTLVDIGDVVTVSLTVTNNGTSEAFDVIVSDPLPSSLTDPQEGTTPAGFAYSVSGNTVTYTGGDIPVGEQRVFTFTARYTGDTSNLTNTAAVTQATTLPGTDPNERDEPDVDDDATIQPTLSSIGNYVWVDEDGDGDQDAGEYGIPGVEVQLELPDGLIITTTTDHNGGYLFDNLPAGTYTVTVNTSTMPAGLAANPTYDEDSGTTSPDHTTVVNLGVDDEHLTADFGYNWNSPDETNNGTGLAAVGDYIWNDADGDGTADPGESGLAGVTVNLLDDDGNVVATTTTDEHGYYIFDGLTPGVYATQVVTSSLPAGFNPAPTGDPDGDNNATSQPFVLAPGDVLLNQDYGFNLPTGHAIGDTIYFDANGDGTQDPEDYGIAGVTVALLDSAGNVIATTTTDENGNYLFPGLPDGDYQVQVTDTNNVLGELNPSADPDGGLDNISAVTLSGSDDLDQDFGYTPPNHDNGDGLIGDTIFLDRDGNGSPDDGEGIEGVAVNLYDANTGQLIATTTTDENGNYSFGNLDASGQYTVTVDTSTLPAGVTNSVDPDGGNDSSSFVDLNADSDSIDLDQDFGYVHPNPASLSGTIWEDRDADGTLEPGETNRFEGVTVVLYDADGNVVGTTVTDANGDYSFTNLPPGTYTVDVVDEDDVLTGYWHSDGPDDGDNNNSQTDGYTVTLGAGDTNDTADFGYYRDPAGLGNRVWYDSDADGVQDSGEPGINGITVTLTITYPDGTVVTYEQVTQNDPDTGLPGWYNFNNLLLDEDYNGAGGGEPQYSVSATLPNGTTKTIIDNGADATDAEDPSGTAANPMQGENGQTPLNADPNNEDNPTAGYDFGITAADWGDLPDTSGTTASQNGPRHVVPPVLNPDGTLDTDAMGPTVWLGTNPPDYTTDGQPSGDATGDGADEDGVTMNPLDWDNGADGGAIDVTLGGTGGVITGYVAVWLDFGDHTGAVPDGTFDSFAGQVITGSGTISFTVPSGTFLSDGSSGGDPVPVRVRVRVFPSRAAAEAAMGGALSASNGFNGAATDGEVEDYVENFSPTAVTLMTFGSMPASVGVPLWLVWLTAVLVVTTLVVLWQMRLREYGVVKRRV